MENTAPENQMKTFLLSQDYKAFLNVFNLTMCNRKHFKNMIFYKSAALLCYLAIKDQISFNKLIQSIQIDEIGNEYIELVIQVYDSINRFDLEALISIVNTCPNELKNLIEHIVKNQQALVENDMALSVGEVNAITVASSDAIESLKDCVYVVKNFLGN